MIRWQNRERLCYLQCKETYSRFRLPFEPARTPQAAIRAARTNSASLSTRDPCAGDRRVGRVTIEKRSGTFELLCFDGVRPLPSPLRTKQIDGLQLRVSKRRMPPPYFVDGLWSDKPMISGH